MEPRRVLDGSPIEVWGAFDFEGDSGSSYLEFQVHLTAPITQPLDVDYTTMDGGSWIAAEAGSDYAATSGTLHFEPGGLTSQIVQVEVFGDTRFEFDEVLTLVCTPSDGSGPQSAEGFIAADDEAPQLSISDAVVVEGAFGQLSYAEFTITRTGAAGSAIQLAYETAFDTADASDLPYTGEWITLEPGETSRVVSIPIYGDDEIESDEGFFVNLFTNDLVEIVDGQGAGTIVNDDPSLLVVSFEHFFFETDSDSTGLLEFAFDPPQGVPMEFIVRAVSGTATAGSDFSPVDQTVIVPPGEFFGSAPITIFGDNEFEADETFTIEVRGVLGNLLATGTATIFNDDSPNQPPVAALTAPLTVGEGGQAVLNGQGSSDPDQPFGSLTYEWDEDYDGVAFEADSTGGFIHFVTFDVDGPATRSVALRVTDASGASSIAVRQIAIENLTPTIDVDEQVVVSEGDTATIATEVFDWAGDTHTYLWRLVSGPSGFTFPDQDTPSLEILPPDIGTYRFSVTVTDDDGAAATREVQLVVQNRVPVASAGPDAAAIEGDLVSVLGSAEASAVDELQYQWSLVASSNGQSIAPQFTPSLDFVPADNGVYQFRLTVTDDDGSSTTDDMVVNVSNAAPTASVDAATAGVAGQTLSLTALAGDPSPADAAAGFAFAVDWGDGTPVQIVTGGTSADLTHAFAAAGNYAATVTAIDKDGGRSDPVSVNVSVAAVLLADGVLYVGGSSAHDSISIGSSGASGSLNVTINGVGQGTFAATERVVVYGGAGNDAISVASNLELDAWLFGGVGNDSLSSGHGDDVLVGGSGNDALSAGRGHDLLFGGSGSDSLSGGQDDDILIGGSSTHEMDETALAAIMAEWTSPRSFAVRKKNLEDGSGSADRLNDEFFLLLGSTVIDDGEADSISGGPGSNWTL